MEIHSMLPLLISIILLCYCPGSLGTGTPFLYCLVANEPDYTIGSTYESNLRHLLKGLPLNDYFYNATYGKAPDQVYGHTMCYADVSFEACSICLSEALDIITDACRYKKLGIVWVDGCTIRYSYALSNASNNNVMSICGPKVPSSKPKRLAEPEIFKDIFQQLTDGLANNASRSPLRLATGKANYTSSANMYVLVQCTRELPSDECQMCVGNLTKFGVETCTYIFDHGDTAVYTDVIFETVSCYVRFALKPFYVIPEAHPPWSNSSIDSSHSSRETISTCIFLIVIGCLLVLVADIHL